VFPFSGLSLKTQELTALFVTARLCCSTLTEANIHTVLDVISLLSTLVVIWMIRFKLKSSYIKDLDNMKLYFVVINLTSHFFLLILNIIWSFVCIQWTNTWYLILSILHDSKFCSFGLKMLLKERLMLSIVLLKNSI